MKRMLQTGVCALIVASVPLVAFADANDCKHECQRQFQEDKRECREREAGDQADSARQFEECLRTAEGQVDERRCSLAAAREERRLSRAKQRCDREAKARRHACRADCQQSPSEP